VDSPYAELDDAELVVAAKSDRGAFDALYRRYVRRVYRYCYAHTGERTHAEDLTAQVFLAALEGLRDLGSSTNISPESELEIRELDRREMLNDEGKFALELALGSGYAVGSRVEEHRRTAPVVPMQCSTMLPGTCFDSRGKNTPALWLPVTLPSKRGESPSCRARLSAGQQGAACPAWRWWRPGQL